MIDTEASPYHAGICFSSGGIWHHGSDPPCSTEYRCQGEPVAVVRKEPAETATVQLDKHAPSAGDWSPAFDGTGRGRFRLDLLRRHAWSRRHRRHHQRGPGGLHLGVHLDASRPGASSKAPSGYRETKPGRRGCLFVPGRNLQRSSRFPVLLAGAQSRSGGAGMVCRQGN
jgi:hypothetical protein